MDVPSGDSPRISICLLEAESGRALTSEVVLPLCRGGCGGVCRCIGRETSWRSFPVELPLLVDIPPVLRLSVLPKQTVTAVIKTCWMHEASDSVTSLVANQSSPQLMRSVTSESEPDTDDGAAVRLKQVWAQPFNTVCVDCGAPSSWASVSLGVFLCIRCAGLHRGLGNCPPIHTHDIS